SILPTLSFLILLTDPFHGLFFGGRNAADPASFLEGGPWFWFHISYATLFILVGMGLIGWTFLTTSGLFHRQAGILLLGMSFPWIATYLNLSRIIPTPGLDLTPIAFSITGLVFAYGFFGSRIMDLVPISRDILVENIEDGILVVDLQGRVVDINPKAMELAGPGVDMPFGKPVEEVFARWEDLIRQYDVTEGRFQVRLPQSPHLYLDVRIIPLRDREGKMIGRLATWYDITNQKQAEEDMRLFRYAVEQNPSAIMITDPEGRIEYVNRQFTNLTGYSLEEVRGKTPRILKSGETPSEKYDVMWETVKGGQTWTSEIINRKKNGELYWADELIAPVQDSKGVVTHFIAMQQDITLRKHNESELMVANTRLKMNLSEIERLHAQLREESIRDGLTRLFNRRYMEETLEREISRAERESRPISAVMMDVDLFKSINDAYGHQAGDNVLQTLGSLLLENTRVGDIACRYGGDEMVVLMPDATLEVALRRAEEWRAAFSLLDFTFGSAAIKTSLSLGVASFPNHARAPIELLVAADKALYRAKTKRNCVVPYDQASMERMVNRSDEIR
ncbi:MAG: diguanylate cyclase, partial [Chloroflexota bacterium]